MSDLPDADPPIVPGVTVRRARQEDGPTIVRLITALADFEKLPPPDKPSQYRLLSDAFGPHPRFEIFLAEREGEIAGYAFVFETYSTFLALPTLYLEDLFVLPEHRGKKVGYALFVHCASEAVRRGCGRFEWAVLDWNASAIAFYEALGATVLPDWRIVRVLGEPLHRLARKVTFDAT